MRSSRRRRPNAGRIQVAVEGGSVGAKCGAERVQVVNWGEPASFERSNPWM